METDAVRSNYKILICDKVDDILVSGLTSRKLDVSYEPEISPQELMQRIPEFDVIVVRSRTKVTGDIIEKGRRLKVIARAGVGIDNIDVKAAQKNNIKIVTAAGSSTDSVVELAISLAINLARHIPELCSNAKRGMFNKKTGVELHSKTAGIIGFGRIGFQTAITLRALGMNIIAYDPIQNEERISSVSGRYSTLQELLKVSDLIFVMVTLDSGSKPVLQEKELSMLKHSVIIVNTSRAEAIHGPSLLNYLKLNRSSSYATDVLVNEPPVEEWEKELASLDNVIVTPHIGAQTVEAQQRIAMLTLERLLETMGVE
ncbi:MAG: 3-phosphoglycerate dehydrogenase [Candidatus Thermoplasmatota archaeon]|nr:3-phosphoglycerate dehydrogenase [Candidatus Thermoplasmatota archaeon]